jgi:hypothetical protein
VPGRSLFIVLAIVGAAPATAQTSAPTAPISSFEVLAGVHAVLHIADMISTSYTLTHPAPAFRAHEANPYLRPFEGRPAVLAAVSGACSVAEVLALEKIRRRHPKVATLAMVGLVVTELIVVTNNVRVAGQLQAARSGWRPPF